VKDGGSTIIKSAEYHQFHAVNKKVGYILSACGIEIEFQKLYGRFPARDEKNPFLIQDHIAPLGAGSEHFVSQCICVEMYNAIIKLKPDWRLTKLMRGRGSAGSWSWVLSGWLCQCPGS